MKAILLSAIAIATVSNPASAKEPEVEIEHAVARVVVIVEDRTDVAVEIEQGTSGLPALGVQRQGDKVRIDGGLARRVGGVQMGDRIRSCRSGSEGIGRPGEGGSVEVSDLGRIDVATAPMIVVRTPRDVNLDASGAVFGSVGRGARSVELGNAGCGDWNIANTDGRMSLSIAGSGDMRAGTSSALEVSIGGSGSVSAGETRGLDVSIGGSGDVGVAGVRGSSNISIGGSGGVRLASVQGETDVSIGGSGDVRIRGGSAPKLSISITGSGGVDFGGTAGDVDVSIAGGGDVRVARATGSVSRAIVGGGDVQIGR